MTALVVTSFIGSQFIHSRTPEPITKAKSLRTKPYREIALSFDDCPRKLGGQMTGMERARKLPEGGRSPTGCLLLQFANTCGRWN
jgi:hypothetical protein